jgi:prepilin-type processing-associated H-X9-DG protein
MNIRSITSGWARWYATLVILSLCWFAAPLAAEELAETEAPPIPADALVVAHVRLADIWKSDAFTEARQMLSKVGPQALRAFDQRFAPAPSTLDRLTVVVRPPAEGARQSIAAFYLTTSTPFDPDRLVKGFFPGGRVQNVGASNYYVDEQAGIALHIVNKQTILFGPPDSVRTVLGKPIQSGGPLELTLKLATVKTPIVVGVNVAALPIPREEIPAPFSAFTALLKAQLFTVAVEIGKQPRVNLSMQFPDQATARDGEKAVRGAIAMARAALPFARMQFEGMVTGKGKESAGTLSDLPEAVGALFALAAIKTCEELLKDFPLELRESTLHASVSLPPRVLNFDPTTGMMIAVLLPAVQKVREAANRVKDSNNLKQIGLAMHMYHDVHNRFPQAAICGKDGKPLLSWRVAILPYIEQDNLFKQFKLDEPWDSSHNKVLLEKMPKLYAMPHQDSTTHTHYRVFVGPDAGFEIRKGRAMPEIVDGLSNTWMVVEAADPVPWTKPDELVYEAKGRLPKLGNFFAGGFNALFMDGSVRYFPRPPDEETMRALITHAGNEIIRLDN